MSLKQSKTFRMSYHTQSNLYYLALAMPDDTETARIEKAIEVLTRLIRNSTYHADLLKHVESESGLFAAGYEHGARQAYSMAGLDFDAACAFCARANPELYGLETTEENEKEGN